MGLAPAGWGGVIALMEWWEEIKTCRQNQTKKQKTASRGKGGMGEEVGSALTNGAVLYYVLSKLGKQKQKKIMRLRTFIMWAFLRGGGGNLDKGKETKRRGEKERKKKKEGHEENVSPAGLFCVLSKKKNGAVAEWNECRRNQKPGKMKCIFIYIIWYVSYGGVRKERKKEKERKKKTVSSLVFPSHSLPPSPPPSWLYDHSFYFGYCTTFMRPPTPPRKESCDKNWFDAKICPGLPCLLPCCLPAPWLLNRSLSLSLHTYVIVNAQIHPSKCRLLKPHLTYTTSDTYTTPPHHHTTTPTHTHTHTKKSM